MIYYSTQPPLTCRLSIISNRDQPNQPKLRGWSQGDMANSPACCTSASRRYIHVRISLCATYIRGLVLVTTLYCYEREVTARGTGTTPRSDYYLLHVSDLGCCLEACLQPTPYLPGTTTVVPQYILPVSPSIYNMQFLRRACRRSHRDPPLIK